jgi:hypothetical protein
MKLYEVYTDTECPRCGCTEARDHGPYEPDGYDYALGPVRPQVHLMTCLGCHKSFDAAPDWLVDRLGGAQGWQTPEVMKALRGA